MVNVGNDREETTVAALLELVLNAAGFKPQLDPRPAPAGSVARRRPDISRLRSLTGFEPRVSLAEGVRETLEWYRRSREVAA